MRDYKRKTDRASTSTYLMNQAVHMVIRNKESVRQVATDLGIDRTTLGRYVKKVHEEMANAEEIPDKLPEVKAGYKAPRQVFTDEEEQALVDYLVTGSKMFYGLCPIEVRGLAYKYGMQKGKRMPENWKEHKLAGEDWFTAFIKRRNEISIRKPEATSIGRATGFNRHNVNSFFDNLQTVMDRDHFEPQSIWNVDETGITTVHKPEHVVGAKGEKQVGQMTSGERGELVTVCCCVNATGNAIPPLFIFPRVHYKDHFIRGGCVGSIGLAYRTRWMTTKNFLVFLRHFVKHVGCSQNKKVLLLMDNHVSHISVDIWDFARENGVVITSFPPHCSNKLQPLDRTVYKPLKTYYNAGASAWMTTNPGKSMTIYDVPELVGYAFPKAMTPENIQSGFRVSGIFPYNRNIFTDDEFLPSQVTDRPNPEAAEDTEAGEIYE